MWVGITLGVSLVLNVALGFYAVWLIKNLTFVSENLNDLDLVIDGFQEHLITIHEMEMFYGDETLGALIDHSKFVKTELRNYKEIMELSDEIDIDQAVEDLEEDGSEKEEKEQLL